MGPYGHQLADGIFMRSPLVPSGDAEETKTRQDEAPQPAPPLLMEFFPPGMFVRDQQYAMETLGIDYMAWWNDQYVVLPIRNAEAMVC